MQMFRLPSLSEWKLTAAAFAVFSVLALPFGLATGLFSLVMSDDYAALARTAAIAMILPALLEEVVFRGPIIWLASRGSKYLGWTVAISLAAFVLWHPLNGAFLLTDARDWFFDWRFLVIAAGLGGVASWLAIRTRSLWPPIIFHWLVVIGWKAFLGAPAFL